MDFLGKYKKLNVNNELISLEYKEIDVKNDEYAE